MRRITLISVRLEPVEGLSIFCPGKTGEGFAKLGPNGGER